MLEFDVRTEVKKLEEAELERPAAEAMVKFAVTIAREHRMREFDARHAINSVRNLEEAGMKRFTAEAVVKMFSLARDADVITDD